MIRPFQADDTAQVVSLWRDAGLLRPWNDPYRDIERKVATDGDGFLVAVVEARVVGTVMVGYDGHRGWVNYLAVDPARRGEGWGRALMEQAEAELRRRGCPKINLQVRGDNQEAVDFYRHLGFSEDPVVSLGKRLIVDEAPHSAGSPQSSASTW